MRFTFSVAILNGTDFFFPDVDAVLVGESYSTKMCNDTNNFVSFLLFPCIRGGWMICHFLII